MRRHIPGLHSTQENQVRDLDGRFPRSRSEGVLSLASAEAVPSAGICDSGTQFL